MKISDIATVKRGSSPRPIINYISNKGYPWLKISDFTYGERYVFSTKEYIIEEGLKNTRYVPKGTLIVTNSASPGIPIFLGKDMCLHDGFLYFENLSNQVVPMYLYYFILSNRDYLVSQGNGSVFTNLKKEILENMPIELPEISHQRHIVDILGSIDEKIESNEQLINIFENLVAKKYLDFANKTSTKIRLEDVIELFDSKRIPLSSREREQRKGIYPYYGATGILDYVNGFLFSGEYVLFAEDGTVTDTNGHPIVQLVNGSFWVNNHAHILKGKNGWNDYTLYVALKQINVDKAVTGAVQPKINQANLLSLEIPNLSNNNLQTINTELDVVFHKVFHLRSENKKLQELKGLYLKKFFE